MSIINTAKYFATYHHGIIDQRRKYTGVRYIMHPGAVVQILKNYGYTDYNILSVAWLHDTLEDTQATLEQLRAIFPAAVVRNVLALTDCLPIVGNRATRKEIDRKRIAIASLEARIVKAADCIDNLSDIVMHDPKFAATYIREVSMLHTEAFSDSIPIFEALGRQLTQCKEELDARSN